MNTSSLLSRARLVDQDAWTQIVGIYGPTVYSWSRKAGLQPDDAADVVQEVFKSAFLRLNQFSIRDGSDSFQKWLFAIYRSRLMDFYRRQKVEPAGAGGSHFGLIVQENLGCDDVEELSTATDHVLMGALKVAQNDFSQRTWTAFWQTVVSGERPRDVAESLEMTAAAVCMCRARVLRRIREQMEGLENF